jgi:hypothetical protein
MVLVACDVDDTAAADELPPPLQAEPATTASSDSPTHTNVDRSNIGALILRPHVVGRSFRNANQVTVLGRPISIVVIAER